MRLYIRRTPPERISFIGDILEKEHEREDSTNAGGSVALSVIIGLRKGIINGRDKRGE